MREYLGNLTIVYEDIKKLVLDTLQSPPKKLEDMAALGAGLYALSATADNQVKRIGTITLNLLRVDYESLVTENKTIVNQTVTLPAQTDKLKFMVTVGKLLELVNVAHERVERMEQLRFQHSKMRRWDN